MDGRIPTMRMQLLVFFSLVVIGVDCALYANRNGHFDTGQLQKVEIREGDRRRLFRQRRAAPGTGQNEVLFTDVVLNGTEDHSHAIVHWTGKAKSEAVFILTLKLSRNYTISDSQTWRSLNYGKTYQKVKFPEGALISSFVVSPADPMKMVFTDVQNKKLYTTKDELRSKDVYSLPVASDILLMHPANPDWMLIYDHAQRQGYVSMNFGKNWTLLQSDVNNMFWGDYKYGDDNKTVHMEIQPQDSERSYYKKCTIPDCSATDNQLDLNLGPFLPGTMLVQSEYIFVQKTDWDGTNANVMVSHNRGEFKYAFFPANVKTKDFLVLNTDEGQVFMAVSHGDNTGASLFLSDVTGRFYTVCLENIHHRATRSWFEVDLHEVKGLPGTYLANQLMDTSTPSQGRKIKTLISVDKGGTWKQLKTNCTTGSKQCDLTLRLDLDSFGMDWILSEEKAPGIVVAHGQIGDTYEDDPKNLSIFTSIDGGWNWIKAPITGLFHFNILDQGGIITAIENGQQNTTNIVYYTYDDGKHWANQSFGSYLLHVDGVLNEPEINTLVLSVYGHRDGFVSPWIMVELNFSKVLNQQCTTQQHETWKPSDHDDTRDELCILGQEISYQRRIPGQRCFYGEPFNRTIIKKACLCDAEDFECDFGYKQVGTKCEPESWFGDSYRALECEEGKPFLKSQGYRKIGSDKCVDGVETQDPYKYQNTTCPRAMPSELILVSNVTVVATGDPVLFHLSQKQGSTVKTQYNWTFGDSHIASLTGLSNATVQEHTFTKSGVYNISVTATNPNGSSVSNVIQLRVEDPVHGVGVFSAWAAKVGCPVTASVVTNIRPTDSLGSLHYVWRFGDEGTRDNGVLTWEPVTNHTYTKPGTYTITATAVNAVSAVSKEIKIKVFEKAVLAQLSFSKNISRLLSYVVFSPAAQAAFSDYIQQELAMRTGVNQDRLCVTLNSTIPVKTNVLVVPPPSGSSSDEPSVTQITNEMIMMVKNGSLYVYRSVSSGLDDIKVTDIQIMHDGGGGSDDNNKQSNGPNYRAVYIAVPIVILASLITGAVLIYYRVRLRNLRRYHLVHQHEDTDVLLDDNEDEPPLDLRSDHREDPRSRDDPMLDLGTGSHLVMVTGSGGGGDAENC